MNGAKLHGVVLRSMTGLFSDLSLIATVVFEGSVLSSHFDILAVGDLGECRSKTKKTTLNGVQQGSLSVTVIVVMNVCQLLSMDLGKY